MTGTPGYSAEASLPRAEVAPAFQASTRGMGISNLFPESPDVFPLSPNGCSPCQCSVSCSNSFPFPCRVSCVRICSFFGSIYVSRCAFPSLQFLLD